MTNFQKAQDGDLIFTAVVTVRTHWQLFALITALFVIYALRILLFAENTVKAEARIKTHEDYTLVAMEVARGQGVAASERKYDKTISLSAVGGTPEQALTQLKKAIDIARVAVREPIEIAVEGLEIQTELIQRELMLLRLEIVGMQATDMIGWIDEESLKKLTASVESLNKAVAGLNSRSNNRVHLVEEPHITSASDKPRALRQAVAAWIVVCLLVGISIHAWSRLRALWRIAGRK